MCKSCEPFHIMKPFTHAIYLGIIAILIVLAQIDAMQLREALRLIDTVNDQLQNIADSMHREHSGISTNGLVIKFKE